MAITAGSIVAGKYRVESVLGAGGMGTVVSAVHMDLQERRAIKILHPDLVGHQAIVERFMREARAVARLKSENVARVYDVGTLDTGEPYIVMEHLQGSDLAKLVREKPKLPIAEVVLYVTQVLRALHEAHSLGIVHRDLKPGNLFLTERHEGGPCIKVLDFGISKVSEKQGEAALTQASDVLGSPSYMAPEQIRGLKNADVRTDIWALGVILYELCTGQRPFRKTKTHDVTFMALTAVPLRPSMVRTDMPKGLEQVILRCLEKDPANRFQNAAELLAALAPFGAAASPAPPPPQRPAAQSGPSTLKDLRQTLRMPSPDPKGTSRAPPEAPDPPVPQSLQFVPQPATSPSASQGALRRGGVSGPTVTPPSQDGPLSNQTTAPWAGPSPRAQTSAVTLLAVGIAVLGVLSSAGLYLFLGRGGGSTAVGAADASLDVSAAPTGTGPTELVTAPPAQPPPATPTAAPSGFPGPTGSAPPRAPPPASSASRADAGGKLPVAPGKAPRPSKPTNSDIDVIF